MEKQVKTIKLKKLYPDAKIPQYATEGSAGFDLIVHNFKDYYSSSNPFPDIPQKVEPDVDTILLTPHSRILVGCGFSVEIPTGKEMQVRARSGLALKKGLTMANGVGTIDSDYRGEIGAILINTSEFAIRITKGEKVAQAIITDYYVAAFEEVEILNETSRAEGGFGSTGV